MSQILPNLWITPGNLARDIQFLKQNSITYILNCAEEESTKYPSYIKYLHIPLIDDEDPEALEQILLGAKTINDWMSSKENIIVHCKAGISRSVTVVLAWFIKYKKYSYSDAYEYIQNKRNIMYPNSFYRKLLKEIDDSKLD